MAPSAYIPAPLRQLVGQRAKFRCEYCQLQQELCSETFEVDHIIPKALGGKSDPDNLCCACPVCNNAKRSQISGRDPRTGRRTRLFDPRRQRWNDHFHWSNDRGASCRQDDRRTGNHRGIGYESSANRSCSSAVGGNGPASAKRGVRTAASPPSIAAFRSSEGGVAPCHADVSGQARGRKRGDTRRDRPAPVSCRTVRDGWCQSGTRREDPEPLPKTATRPRVRL